MEWMVTRAPNRDQEEKSICGWRDAGSDLSVRSLRASGGGIWELGLRREIWAEVGIHCW